MGKREILIFHSFPPCWTKTGTPNGKGLRLCKKLFIFLPDQKQIKIRFGFSFYGFLDGKLSEKNVFHVIFKLITIVENSKSSNVTITELK